MRGAPSDNRDNAIRCKEALYQLLCEIWEGQLLLVLLLTNLYTGYFYSYMIFTLGTYIYSYHRSPVKINLKDEKSVYIKKSVY